MNVNSRFLGEYALTGAFFWVAQFIVLVTIDPAKEHPDEQPVVDQVSRIIDHALFHLPVALQDSTLAIVFLALIVVFFTGLVLDLLKVAFRASEMNKLMDDIEECGRSSSWLDQKVEDYCPYVEEYHQLCQYHLDNSKTLRNRLLVFIPGIVLIGRFVRTVGRFGRSITRRARSAAVAGWDLLRGRKGSGRGQPDGQDVTTALTVHDLIPHYVKLHSFLLSFVLVHSDQTNLEPLTQGTRLWRSSREISVAILILLVEVMGIMGLLVLAGLLPLSELWSYLSSQLSQDDDIAWIRPTTVEWKHLVSTFVALTLLLFVSLHILRSVFSRLCYTLLSLFYITTEKVELDNGPREIMLSRSVSPQPEASARTAKDEYGHQAYDRER